MLVQQSPHERFCISTTDDDSKEFLLDVEVGDTWRTLHRFGLEQCLMPDIEMFNWSMATDPSSIFVTGLMAARPLTDRRLTLANASLSVHHVGGPTETRRLSTVQQLRSVLERDFGIVLDDLPELDNRLRRLVQDAA